MNGSDVTVVQFTLKGKVITMTIIATFIRVIVNIFDTLYFIFLCSIILMAADWDMVEHG